MSPDREFHLECTVRCWLGKTPTANQTSGMSKEREKGMSEEEKDSKNLSK